MGTGKRRASHVWQSAIGSVCLFAGILTSSVAGLADTVAQKSVSQYGITWEFDREYTTGRFANGDWWVLGPVTITRITPDFDGRKNGWEVNPAVNGKQGLHAGADFDSSLVPSLPYTARGTVSIVKTVASGREMPLIKTAAVLTVVETAPEADGSAVFRPPYVGTEKPFYRVADLKTGLLPAYPPVSPMPTLASIEQTFSGLRLDHKDGAIGRALRPQDSMSDYQPANTPAYNEGALRLMVNDDIKEKMPALIKYIQHGIDKIHTIYLGQTWPDGGGHQPGHRIVPAFTAVLLDLPHAKQMLREATFFHGSRWFWRGKNGMVLWGQPSSEKAYWDYIIAGRGNRSNRDPYGYIDGGKVTEGAYQVITSQAHKGEILATILMPALKEAWNPVEWQMVKEYVERWVSVGQWAQPDPIAPYDGKPENYGVTYGPDPKHAGQPIPGAGRFPEAHGTHKDGGQYRSAFVAAMWDAYKEKAEKGGVR